MSDRPWFKTRRYGVGARPVTWQGYLISLIAFLAILIGMKWISAHRFATDPGAIALAILFIVVVASVVMFVSAQKSDKPWRWRWGQDD
jgi:hypothetical protein